MSDIPVTYTVAYGKKWIFVQSSFVLQCAYCIYVQPLTPVRDDTGLVVAVKIREDEQSHSVGCPQAVDQAGIK